MRLKDKVAIITGAARGIGEATAFLFAREGAKVVVADKRQEEGDRVVKQIKDEGGEAIFTAVDITEEDQVKKMVETTVKNFDSVNVLVNNAGVFVLNPVHELTNEQYNLVMNTDVRGYFWCSKYVIPHMLKAGGGSIIMNSSASAFVADPDLAIYCAAKSAVNGLVRGMALDYGRYNIRVNSVCPGTIDTPFNIDYFNAMPDPEAARREIGATHVLGRMGTALEMAYCFLFLACDESSFVTGSNLMADGGMSIIDAPLTWF